MSEPGNDKKLRRELSLVSGAELARHGGDLLVWLRENIKDPLVCLAVLDTVRAFLSDQMGLVHLDVNKVPEPAEGGKSN